MANLPPLSGWPQNISPIGDPDRRRQRSSRGSEKKRHLRERKEDSSSPQKHGEV
ncbi:MAG: hypothetical protein KGZ39_06255 [Simkania sp.]|nr:hypothetical protein [Simkania sp.]